MVSVGLLITAGVAAGGWFLSRYIRSRRGTTTPSDAAATKTAPTVLGHYRIERPLGRGAMGAVYLAVDVPSGRTVALKTMALRHEFEGEALTEARERFFREAETAGRLQHADIVAVLAHGEAHGLAYMAMEFVAGEDLSAHVTPGRLLPVPVIVATVARAAEALAHAHRQGVLHRDVKPANIMIDLASGSVKVTDFGIARLADARRTRTGLLLGTPLFMSPEQLAGGRIDGRSDLYSLGVVLFQLLTGSLPHHAESMAALMRQIAHDAAPDVRSLRPELPESLARIVATALAKRPPDRHADGSQMARELRAVVHALA